MASRMETGKLGTVKGPKWSKKNPSLFEYDSHSDGSLASSGYESNVTVEDDLNLYDA
jgi:hypothetical protein